MHVVPILLLDNRDSFVHNLARYFRKLGHPTEVVRSDSITAKEIADRTWTALVVSPGPCTPDEAGCSLEAVRANLGKLPILGVCLGHQVIGQSLGGRIVRVEPVHGMASQITHSGQGIFATLPQSIAVGRYHSLAVDREGLPPRVRVTATTTDGIIMGIEDAMTPTWGLQFHPESLLTEYGEKMLANFIRYCTPQTSQRVNELDS